MSYEYKQFQLDMKGGQGKERRGRFARRPALWLVELDEKGTPAKAYLIPDGELRSVQYIDKDTLPPNDKITTPDEGESFKPIGNVENMAQKEIGMHTFAAVTINISPNGVELKGKGSEEEEVVALIPNRWFYLNHRARFDVILHGQEFRGKSGAYISPIPPNIDP